MRHAKLRIEADTPTGGKVYLNDQDISSSLYRLQLNLEAGEVNMVLLELYVDEIQADVPLVPKHVVARRVASRPVPARGSG